MHETQSIETHSDAAGNRTGLSVISLKFQLIPGLSISSYDGSSREFEYRMGPQTERDSAANHVRPDLHDSLVTIEKHNVDGKLHAERVNTLAGSNPKSFSGLEAGMLQESSAPLRAGIRDIGPVREYPAPALIGNAQLNQIPTAAQTPRRLYTPSAPRRQ